MAQTIFTLSPEMQQSWDYVMGQMLSFVDETGADVDMAYDFVCEQLDIGSFVDNQELWDDFYASWEAAQANLWSTLLCDTNWWTVYKVSTKPPRTPLIVYSIEVEGRAPRHTLNPL